MSDPRHEERLRAQRDPDWLPTRVDDRIAMKLSPCDDELGFAQAVRQKEEMDRGAAAFAKRRRSRK